MDKTIIINKLLKECNFEQYCGDILNDNKIYEIEQYLNNEIQKLTASGVVLGHWIAESLKIKDGNLIFDIYRSINRLPEPISEDNFKTHNWNGLKYESISIFNIDIKKYIIGGYYRCFECQMESYTYYRKNIIYIESNIGNYNCNEIQCKNIIE